MIIPNPVTFLIVPPSVVFEIDVCNLGHVEK